MNSFFRLLAVAGALLLLATTVEAATAPPPLPPLPVSPVATFRELMALPPPAQEVALQRRPEAQRAVLRARLEEYARLPEAVREERLRATDLYWHLNQLMRRAPGERADLLRQSPADLREVLTERLALWDRLPESDRDALLAHDRAVRYLARTATGRTPPLPPVVQKPVRTLSPPMPPLPVRAARDWVQLQSLSPAQRSHLRERWERWVDLSPGAVERLTNELPAEDRERLAQVLQRFAALPAGQRRACLESFSRLTSLPASDLVDFLRHAQRWEELSAEERESWRQVAVKLPPLPPARSVAVDPAG